MILIIVSLIITLIVFIVGYEIGYNDGRNNGVPKMRNPPPPISKINTVGSKTVNVAKPTMK